MPDLKKICESRGYVFERDLHTVSDHIAVATKDGNEYCITRSGAFKFPKEGIHPDLYKRWKKEAEDHLNYQRALINALKGAGPDICTLVDVFSYDRRIYCVYDNVYRKGAVSLDEMSFTEDEKLWLAKQICTNVSSSHKHGVLIGGIINRHSIKCVRTSSEEKPISLIMGNIDPGFILVGKLTEPEHTSIYDAYAAPELLAYKMGHEKYAPYIGTATDVFALGIVLHELWCGDVPDYPGKEKGGYVSWAVARGDEITLSDSLPEFLRDLVGQMLKLKPAERPSMELICTQLNEKNFFSNC